MGTSFWTTSVTSTSGGGGAGGSPRLQPAPARIAGRTSVATQPKRTPDRRVAGSVGVALSLNSAASTRRGAAELVAGGAPDARPEARGAGNWTWKLFFAPPGSPSSASRSRATRTVAVSDGADGAGVQRAPAQVSVAPTIATTPTRSARRA